MISGFFVAMVNKILSIRHILALRKGFLAFSISLLLTLFSNKTTAQDLRVGFIGGMNMSTISSKNEESGFKVGINLGGIAQYKINNNSSIISNLKFATKGQQFSIVKESSTEYLKTYHSTTLYYIDIPIMFQYYFEDMIGVEAGPTMGFCLGGKDKSKIGNESWTVREFENGKYNPFELGMTFGVFTRDLGQSSFNNIFIEIRYFTGFTQLIKDFNYNHNNGVLINIGYIIERPLKRK